jgi:hypothetical protein
MNLDRPRFENIHGKTSMLIVVLCMLLQCESAFAQTGLPSERQSSKQGRVEVTQVSGSLIGIQYEHWFEGPDSWKTAEAIPLLGKYATDEATITKHFSQFRELGIDWLLIDWSNMLWSKPEWELHSGDTGKLEVKTDVLVQTALHLHQQGKYSPKLVFMIGLQNGPPIPNGVQRLNGELDWLQKNYFERPEYKDLWLYDHGKPLLIILYWPPNPCEQLPRDLAAVPLNAQAWSVRWMSSQLQDNHAEQCGMWSWMDGVIPQVVTRRNGIAEEIVVTPSSFQLPRRGWTAPSAIARDHGVPYLLSWKAAFQNRPRFIQVHQWNEFTGQQEGHGLPDDYWGQKTTTQPQEPGPSTVYADEYSEQLSDDIEPTFVDGCTLRGCGGWGYYYFNLTRAIISLYRGITPDITVLALSGPKSPLPSGAHSIDLHWAFLGRVPSSYSLYVDGKQVQNALTGTAYTLDIRSIGSGHHTARLKAAGVHTYFSLDPQRTTSRSSRSLPVESEITFETVEGTDQR